MRSRQKNISSVPVEEYLVSQVWKNWTWPSNVNTVLQQVLPISMSVHHSAHAFLQPHGKLSTNPRVKPPFFSFSSAATGAGTELAPEHRHGQQCFPCVCSPTASEGGNNHPSGNVTVSNIVVGFFIFLVSFAPATFSCSSSSLPSPLNNT